MPHSPAMNMQMVRRENRKHVVLNDDELELIEAAAARRGIGVTTFLRQAGLEAARRDGADSWIAAARVTASPDGDA